MPHIMQPMLPNGYAAKCVCEICACMHKTYRQVGFGQQSNCEIHLWFIICGRFIIHFDLFKIDISVPFGQWKQMTI